MKILVTGVKGQLGYDVVKELEKRGHTAIGTDVDNMDITDANATRTFIKEAGADAVIHCAAYTAVDLAEDNVELCNRINVDGTRNIAEVCKELDIKMIYISTDYVFDGCGHRPYLEDDPTNPQTVYGRTKLEGEEAVIRTCAGSMVVRTAWLYSTFGNNFVKTMLRLGKERETLGVVFDQVGSPTYARDLAAFILTAIDRGIVPGVYHYTNEGVCSWYDFTRAIHRIAGIEEKDCKVRPILTEEYPVPAPRPHFSVLDKQKVKNTYGIDIPWWEDSLKECLKELL